MSSQWSLLHVVVSFRLVDSMNQQILVIRDINTETLTKINKFKKSNFRIKKQLLHSQNSLFMLF